MTASRATTLGDYVPAHHQWINDLANISQNMGKKMDKANIRDLGIRNPCRTEMARAQFFSDESSFRQNDAVIAERNCLDIATCRLLSVRVRS
jgi:hypothetical protein